MQMDVYHTLFIRRAWMREWNEMLQKWEEETGDRLSTVRQLLELGKMTDTVMSFLTTTRVGQ